MTKIAITGVGPDRPGIVAGLTQVLFACGANIEDSSMTMLDAQFAMILIVTLPATVPLTQIQADFEPLQATLGLTILIQPLSLATGQAAVSKERPTDPPMMGMISVAGQDRTGITYHVSQFLAQHQVSISDLNAQVISGEGSLVYIMMIEITIPPHLDLQVFEQALTALGQTLGMEIRFRQLERVSM